MYRSGILSGDECGEKVDHGVLIVGYGTENDLFYYIVQNNWGASWGDHGYIKIAGAETGPGACGIQQYNYLPSCKSWIESNKI